MVERDFRNFFLFCFINMSNILEHLIKKNEFEFKLFTEHSHNPVYGNVYKSLTLNPDDVVTLMNFMGPIEFHKQFMSPLAITAQSVKVNNPTPEQFKALASQLNNLQFAVHAFEEFPLKNALHLGMVTGFQGYLNYDRARKLCMQLKQEIGDSHNIRKCNSWHNVNKSLQGLYFSENAYDKYANKYNLKDFLKKVNSKILLADSRQSMYNTQSIVQELEGLNTLQLHHRVESYIEQGADLTAYTGVPLLEHLIKLFSGQISPEDSQKLVGKVDAVKNTVEENMFKTAHNIQGILRHPGTPPTTSPLVPRAINFDESKNVIRHIPARESTTINSDNSKTRSYTSAYKYNANEQQGTANVP